MIQSRLSVIGLEDASGGNGHSRSPSQGMHAGRNPPGFLIKISIIQLATRPGPHLLMLLQLSLEEDSYLMDNVFWVPERSQRGWGGPGSRCRRDPTGRPVFSHSWRNAMAQLA